MPSVSDRRPSTDLTSSSTGLKTTTIPHSDGSTPGMNRKPSGLDGSAVAMRGPGAGLAKSGGLVNQSPNTLRSLLEPYTGSPAGPSAGVDGDAPRVETIKGQETGGPGSAMGKEAGKPPSGRIGQGIAAVLEGQDQDDPDVQAGAAVAGAAATVSKAAAEEAKATAGSEADDDANASGRARTNGVAPRRRSSGRRNASSSSNKSRRPGSSHSPPPLPTGAASGSAEKKMAEVPSSSRVDPSIVQRVDPEITVRTAWQLLPFLTKQATDIASNFVSHHLYGPPKKSWGIEMTIFTGLVRSASAYSHLSSIERLRRMLDLGQILPTPKDGIITPVSWKVKRRGLRGFLREADRAEDGKRELTGEWVVSKRMWKKMQADHAKRLASQNGGSAKAPSSPESSASTTNGHHHPAGARPGVKRRNTSASGQTDKDDTPAGKEKIMLYLHGGAYFVMSAATHRPLTISVAKYTDCRLFAINYRLAPETKFPGALHDAASAYFRLIYDLKIPPENIIIAGDSAGGGLTTALLMYLRDEKYPLPCGAILMSPWSDLTMSCDSWDSNLAYDYLPMPKQDDPLNPVKCYLGEEGVRKYITHPYASPLFGDFHGLPPLLIQAGDAEVLRDEVTLLAHKASLHGVRVEHELYEDCVHVFQAFLFLEASRKALQSQRQFVRRTLPALQAEADAAKERKKAKLAKTAAAAAPPVPTAAATAKPKDPQQASPTTDLPPSPTRLATPAARRPGDAVDSSADDSDAPAGVSHRADIRAVDAEISSDAHLVTERSQTLAESLPATPTGSSAKLPGETESADGSSGEEMLSTPEAERDNPSVSSPTPLAPPVVAPAADVAKATAPAESSAAGRFGLSLRGRLPPAMDISTLQSLFMSKSQPSTPAPPGGARRGSTPQALTTADGEQQAGSAQTSGQASPTAQRHRRSQSSNAPLDIHKVTDRAPAAPIRARTGSHPDLMALLDSYNTAQKTPGLGNLRTTVWRQGDAPDPDGEYEDYFRPADQAEPAAEAKKDATTPGEGEAPRYAFESPGYGFS